MAGKRTIGVQPCSNNLRAKVALASRSICEVKHEVNSSWQAIRHREHCMSLSLMYAACVRASVQNPACNLTG